MPPSTVIAASVFRFRVGAVLDDQCEASDCGFELVNRAVRLLQLVRKKVEAPPIVGMLTRRRQGVGKASAVGLDFDRRVRPKIPILLTLAAIGEEGRRRPDRGLLSAKKSVLGESGFKLDLVGDGQARGAQALVEFSEAEAVQIAPLP
jgi:hypothetical protein